MTARVSRESAETLVQGTGKGRLARESAETLVRAPGKGRAARISAEVLIDTAHVPPATGAFEGWGIPL